jgi:hypothetical protein
MGWRSFLFLGIGLFAGYLIFSPRSEPVKPVALVSKPLDTTGLRPLENQPDRKKEIVGAVLTAAAIAALLVQESRSAYYATGRPCACPDDTMRNGRRCGGNSAYSKPGGAQPLCYVTDVPPAMVEKHRARLSQR